MKQTSKTDWKKLDALPDKDIDLTDIPELGADFFANAELRMPEKQTITIRIDTDVLEFIKGQGKGYQTRINKLLRAYMEVQQKK